jgi:Tol biopolymer transport system component
LWITKTGNKFDPVQITTGGADKSVSGISWTRDGRVVFGATSMEGQDLWISGMSGGKPTQLTQGGANAYPSVSADGKYIVYRSTSSPRSHIWRIDLDGSNPVQLTFGEGEYHPQCHPDGVSVFYLEESSRGYTLFKVPLLGGEAVLVSDRNLARRPPAISPDGKEVGVRSYDESSNKWRIEIFQIDGGGNPRTLDLEESFFQWSPSGSALDYSKWVGDAGTIWSQPLNNDPPVQLTFFKTEWIPYFSWAPDGKTLAVEKLNNKWDVVLLKNFR